MVNLAPAQVAVERLMTDRVRLYRNPGGIEDDTLSPEPQNLTLEPGLVESYYDGRAMVRVNEANEGDGSSGLPLAVQVETDDILEVAEARDDGIVGRWFRVDQVRGGTFAVSRRVVLVEVGKPTWL